MSTPQLNPIVKVLRDVMPMIHFGISTGQLTLRNDGYAPDRNLPMLLEPEALGLHTLIIGLTGVGKSVLLKQLIQDYVRSGVGGLLVMDGKSALPGELVGMKDNARNRTYTYIDPRHCVLALIEGLDPQGVTRALAEINVVADAKDPVWQELTRSLVSASAEILWWLVHLDRGNEKRTWRWTFADLDRVAVMIQSQTNEDQGETQKHLAVLKEHCKEQMGGLLGNAIAFAEHEIPAMAESVRGSVLGTYKSWSAPIMSHPDILKWAQAETGVTPEGCLSGDLVGVNLGEVMFGRAGVIASSFVKNRVYTKGKLRADFGNDWTDHIPGSTPCWIVLDEYQAIATRAEAEIAKQGRSLGLWLCCASQDVEGIYATNTNQHLIDTFLGNLSNLIFMQSTDKSGKWLQDRVGPVWVPQWQNNTRGIDYIGSVANALGAPIYNKSHPSRKIFKSFLRRGFGKFHHVHFPSTNQQWVREDDQAENFNRHNLLIGGGWQEEPLLSVATHMEQTEQRATAEQGAIAFVELRRAGAKRRDYVQLPKPAPIADDLLDPKFIRERDKARAEKIKRINEDTEAFNDIRDRFAQTAATTAD